MPPSPARARAVALALVAAFGGSLAAWLALSPPVTTSDGPEPARGAASPARLTPSGPGGASPAPAAPRAPASREASSAPAAAPEDPTPDDGEAPAQNAAIAAAPEEGEADEVGPFDTAHPPADPCRALAQDDERLALTQGFIDKLPAKNRDKAGAKVLYDLRDRTEKARARHQAQADAAGLDCGADE